MRITTWNVNGLRAAQKKGFSDFIARIRPDVLLLQEVRCTLDQLPEGIVAPAGYHAVWHAAERKGYSGVAVWSREPIDVIGTGKGASDPEGRVLHVRTGGVQVVSVYLPSGSSSLERQAAKEVWMAEFRVWCDGLLASAREPVVLGGDLNIAHTEQDIHNPRGNAKNSGFLPHERAWFGELLSSGWGDLVRQHAGPCQGPYSWWSNRGQARILDRGWRIDYLLGSPSVGAKSAETLREAGLTVSDHAPVTVEIC